MSNSMMPYYLFVFVTLIALILAWPRKTRKTDEQLIVDERDHPEAY